MRKRNLLIYGNIFMKQLKNLKISEELHKAVKIQAALEGITIAECVERCLVKWVAAWQADAKYSAALANAARRAARAAKSQNGMLKSGE